jgi:tocopherol O-methyltransferase
MNPAIDVASIRRHYDGLSPLYRRFWGEHIHHGFWQNGESRRIAQIKLIEQLAAAAGVPRGANVLDVGCGVGGSSLWLARELGCSVLGITLSPVQIKLANGRARATGLTRRVRFEVRDANNLDTAGERFDVVWTVECSEHLFDKARFCENCARALRRGGRFALCAWLASPASREDEDLVHEVCRGMLCPSLGSMDEYLRWIRAAGFTRIRASDITRHVAPTWNHVDAILRRREVQMILHASNSATREFVRACTAIRRAYATGAMAYGLFTAEMPSSWTQSRPGPRRQ